MGPMEFSEASLKKPQWRKQVLKKGHTTPGPDTQRAGTWGQLRWRGKNKKVLDAEDPGACLVRRMANRDTGEPFTQPCFLPFSVSLFLSSSLFLSFNTCLLRTYQDNVLVGRELEPEQHGLSPNAEAKKEQQ